MSALLKVVLTWVLSSTIIKVMVALGLGFLTYTGLEAAIDAALGSLASMVGGLPEGIYAMLARVGLFEGLSIIGSAMLLSAAIKSAKVFVGIKS